MTSDVLRQRAEIEESIRGRTVCDQLRETAERFADDPALSQAAPDGPDPAGWPTLTWAQARQQALRAGGRLHRARPRPRRAGRDHDAQPDRARAGRLRRACTPAGSRSPSTPPWPPSRWPSWPGTARPGSPCWTGRTSWPGGSRCWPSLPGLGTIIVRDASACPAGEQYLTWDDFAALGRERLAADPALVHRAAGRDRPGGPGHPAVHLGDHRQPQGRPAHPPLRPVRGGRGGERGGTVNPHVRWVSYLPLAHIAERMFSIYLPLSTAGHVYFCPDAQQLIKTVGEVKPDRVLRRAAGVGEDQGRDPGPAGRRGRPGPAGRGASRPWTPAAGTCESTPVRPDHAGRAGRGVPPGRRAGAGARSGRCSGWARRDVVSSAAAPLPPEVGAFFAGLGPEDPGHLRDDRDHRRVHLQHRDRVPAGHRGAGVRGHRDQDRGRRRDPHPGAAQHARLPEPARPDRGADRRRRLAAHRGHRQPGRRRLPVRGGPEEGAHHHRGRGERAARRASRTCWSRTR